MSCRTNNTAWRLTSTATSSVSVDSSNHSEIQYSRGKLGNFLQEKPVLGNQYLNDATLKSYLRRHVKPPVSKPVARPLDRG